MGEGGGEGERGNEWEREEGGSNEKYQQEHSEQPMVFGS